MSICDSPVAPVITTARNLRSGELYTLDRSPVVCLEASTQSATSESISFTLDPRNYQVRADGTNVRAPIPVAPASASTSAPAKPLPMVAAQYEFVNVRAATIWERSSRDTTLSSPPDRLTSLRFHLTLPLALPFVMQFLPFCNCKFTLDPAVLQVDLGRDKGQPFFARRPQQLVDFAAMQQQLAPSRRLVIFAVA